MAIPEYGVTNYVSPLATGTTIPIVVPAGGYAAGDAVFVFAYNNANQTGAVTVTDPRSNAWTIAKSGDTSSQIIWAYSILTTALIAGDTLTLNVVSSQRRVALMWARPGVLSLTLDGALQIASTDVAGPSMVAPATSNPLAAANELIYAGFCAGAPNSAAQTFTVGTGWDLVGSVSAAYSATNKALLVETRRPSDLVGLNPVATEGSSALYFGSTFVLRDVSGAGGAGGAGSSAYKVLGQVAPAATQETPVLYTVPIGRQAVCSSLVVCNTASSATTFRAYLRIGGAAFSGAQYLFYEAAIGALQTITATIGVTLGAGDIVVARSANGSTIFHLFGQEIVP